MSVTDSTASCTVSQSFTDGRSEFAPQHSDVLFLLLSHTSDSFSSWESGKPKPFWKFGEDLFSSVQERQNWGTYFPNPHGSFRVGGVSAAPHLATERFPPSDVTSVRVLNSWRPWAWPACVSSSPVIEDSQRLSQRSLPPKILHEETASVLRYPPAFLREIPSICFSLMNPLSDLRSLFFTTPTALKTEAVCCFFVGRIQPFQKPNCRISFSEWQWKKIAAKRPSLFFSPRRSCKMF